eukprot:4588800-Amphidinium_carterae.1
MVPHGKATARSVSPWYGLSCRLPANPADVVMDLISLDSALRWMEKGMLLKPENAEVSLAEVTQH